MILIWFAILSLIRLSSDDWAYFLFRTYVGQIDEPLESSTTIFTTCTLLLKP